MAEIPDFDVTFGYARFGRKQQESKMATEDRSPSLFLGQSWASWADKLSITDGNGNFIMLYQYPCAHRIPTLRIWDTCWFFLLQCMICVAWGWLMNTAGVLLPWFTVLILQMTKKMIIRMQRTTVTAWNSIKRVSAILCCVDVWYRCLHPEQLSHVRSNGALWASHFTVGERLLNLLWQLCFLCTPFKKIHVVHKI